MPDKYDIPLPPPPEPSERRPHRITEQLNKIAIAISILAALFSFLQWRAADRQADAADGARQDAKNAAAEQKSDVERSRAAAEVSAEAAKQLAEGMKRNASAAQTTADASTQSAVAAQRAAHFAETSFQVSHRAYMILDTATLSSQPVDGQPWKFILTFKNVGQTPALSVNANWRPQLLPASNPTRLTFFEAPALGTENIGPGLSFSAHGAVEDLSSEQVRWVIDKRIFLSLLATVAYKDIFGAHHSSEWCGAWMYGQVTGLDFGFCSDTLFHSPLMN